MLYTGSINTIDLNIVYNKNIRYCVLVTLTNYQFNITQEYCVLETLT